MREKTFTATKDEESRTFLLRETDHYTEICYSGDQTGTFKRQMSFETYEAGDKKFDAMAKQMSDAGITITTGEN